MMNARTARSSALRTSWLIVAAISTILVSGMAPAAQDDALPHEVVSFKDLNLKTSEGAAILYKRIQAAARRVCGTPDLREVGKLVARGHCIDGAVSRSVASINSPALTSIYLSKTGASPQQLVSFSQRP